MERELSPKRVFQQRKRSVDPDNENADHQDQTDNMVNTEQLINQLEKDGADDEYEEK